MIVKYNYKEVGRPHGYEGILYEEKEINMIFPNQIRNSLTDVKGTNTLITNAENYLSTTGFADEGIKELLIDIYQIDIIKHNPFRVGEAFAEFHIEQNCNATFYYNELSDARNPLGNKTGADLLGTVELQGETVFLFGETKTSSEQKSPPGPPAVLYSQTNKKTGKNHKGMIEQLQELAKDESKRDNLIRVLGFKIKDSTKNSYFLAVKNYINSNKKKFHLFGVLVRDTNPEEKDIEARYKTLAKDIDKEIGLKLIALYVPIKKEEWNALIHKK